VGWKLDLEAMLLARLSARHAVCLPDPSMSGSVVSWSLNSGWLSCCRYTRHRSSVTE